MRFRRTGLSLVLLLAGGVSAHTKLDAPPEWLVTDSLGDPQKTEPCGSTTGPESSAVTTVQAGSKLTLVWTETVFHPGHWRIALTADRTQLVTPTPVVVADNCVSAPIETTPTAPVILDGVFEHTVPSPTNYQQEITVPDMACERCTLQLIQFMSSHTPPCFYFHCATLRIVQGDGGTGGGPDGGTGGGGTGQAGAVASGCGAGPGALSAFAALAALVWGLMGLGRLGGTR